MRIVASVIVGAAVVVGAASAAQLRPTPPKLSGSVEITFAGRGEQTMHEYKQWIYQVDNRCGYDKTVDNRATFSWRSTWGNVSIPRLAAGLGGRSLAAATATASGRISGTEIRTDCGYPVPLDGWAGTSACDEPFEPRDDGTLDARAAAVRSVIVDLQAPTLGMKTPTQCALRPRSSQLTASLKLSLPVLARLKRGKALSIHVGTNVRSLVPHAPEYNCSNSEPPYEGVQIDDRCLDVLAWDGNVTIVKR